MTKPTSALSPAEFSVLKLLWDLRKATVAEVQLAHKERYERDLAYTTVMTLLGRLAEKGAVKVDKAKQPYLYRPTIRRQSFLKQRLREFIDTVFDGEADALVMQLIDDESLSAAELRKIEARILGEDVDD